VKQAQHSLTFATAGSGLYEITREVRAWAEAQAIATGLLTLYSQHTSASLVIQENADPQVQDDLQRFFRRLVPDGDPLFRHTAEGPDDMPAHVKSALTQSSLNVPMGGGRLMLGTWQGIYLFEHRVHPHRRHVVLHIVGE
jgi:secondary thiamine-phosphate synthase enzyme